MAKTLTFNGVRYLMRDQRPRAEILHQWQAFQAKYGGRTAVTFDEWLNRGRVYLRLPAKGGLRKATAMATNVVLPIVHLNGTSKEELLRQCLAFHTALREAERKLCDMTPNGRDYYVEPGRLEQANAQHRRRLLTLAELMAEIELEIEGINGQG